jgi:hypothetical protein
MILSQVNAQNFYDGDRSGELNVWLLVSDYAIFSLGSKDTIWAEFYTGAPAR